MWHVTSIAAWTSQCSAALPDLLLLAMFRFHTVELVSHMLGRRSLSSSGRRYVKIGWEAVHETSSKHTLCEWPSLLQPHHLRFYVTKVTKLLDSLI